MAEPLWKIRQRKGLRVNQLAAKSGVPAISIQEYEAGRAIRSADLPKLAKALYVEEWDIELKGSPRPKSGRPQAARPTAPAKAAPKAPATRQRKPPPSPLARPSQIEHLVTMTTYRLGKDQAKLEEEIGKPLETMTRSEAKKWLKHYQQLLVTVKTTPQSPDGEVIVKRKRAYLPESVDEFELKYLTAQQEDEALLHFTLFDGQEVRGRIVGFSPYNITLREEETGEEVTLQKLAIAYYRRVATAVAGAERKGRGES